MYTLCFHLHEVLQKGKLIYVNKIKTVESYVGGDYLGSINAYLNWGAAYMALYNCQNETAHLKFMHFIIYKLYLSF